MKRIWIFNHHATEMFFNQEGRHYSFSKCLSEKNYNISIFCSNYLHRQSRKAFDFNNNCYIKQSEQIKFIFVKTNAYKNSKIKRILSMFQYYFNLLKIADDFEKPDVIIGSSVHPLACVAAIKLSKKYKCKNIIEIRDLWPETLVSYGLISKKNPVTKILYILEKWIYKKADKLIFTMKGGKDYIIDKGWDKSSDGPIDLNKIYHINNGVDLEKFNYNKEHYKINDDDLKNQDIFKIVYTGSIRFVNNLGILIDVAKKLEQKGYNKIKFLIWGTGDQLEFLRQRVKDEKLDNIVFKGYVEKKYIPYITANANANANAVHYKSESIYQYGVSHNKLFDYLSAGKPVLNFIPVNFDIIVGNNAGLSVQEQSIKNICEIIIKIYNMPKNEYDQMCDNALKTAKEYDFKRLTDKLISIIEERK